MSYCQYLAGLVAVFLFTGCASGPRPELESPSTERHDPRPAAELVSKGREAAEHGDAVRAEQYLSLAIKEGAERNEVLPLLMTACLQSSHLRTALNYAEPYLLEHPEADELRYLVATVHLGLGQRNEAKRELLLLLRKNAKDPDAHYLLGVLDSALDVAAAKSHFLIVLSHSKDETQRIEVKSRLAELSLETQQAAGIEVEEDRDNAGETL